MIQSGANTEDASAQWLPATCSPDLGTQCIVLPPRGSKGSKECECQLRGSHFSMPVRFASVYCYHWSLTVALLSLRGFNTKNGVADLEEPHSGDCGANEKATIEGLTVRGFGKLELQ